MKKHLLFLFSALLPMLASAQTKVEIDGIWYKLTSETKQAEVTSKSSGKYSGSITLPATVTHEGVDYSVTSIGQSAFEGCSSLTAINIPEGVTSIGGYAFYDCSSLTTITIPASVTYIESSAFKNSSNLLDVYCYAETLPTANKNIFQGSNYANATLHVPASALDAYKTTVPWNSFGTIVALTEEDMGVDQFTIDNSQFTVIYDLHGRRVATPTKCGIYIINGRKVVVK